MLRSPLRLFLAAAVLGVLLYFGARGSGSLPPLGPFLDPANGVWALARTAEFPRRGGARIPGLTAIVEVFTDDRGVPHVFARTEEDAWRAQGYLVARDRLFQMELQSRAGAGTLAELLGPRAAEPDRATRRRGFAWAAERSLAAMDSSSLMARAARAYADGVNAWIDHMGRSDLPLEYRLLARKPARRRPLDYFYSSLQMVYTLGWEDETLSRLQVRGLVGTAAAEALLPRNSPIQEPIQPNGQRVPRFDFVRPFPPPGSPETSAWIAATERESLDLASGWTPSRPGAGDAVGSNNWVVGPGRTAGGHAILAGDPHLELSLPSVWYEIHLHVDAGTDATGVSFPGAPGVIIGFNRDVAWSFTNTGPDVRDHYFETVDDAARPTRYMLDGAWKPLESRVEVVRGRRGEALFTDTIHFNHRGPLFRQGSRWLSFRWTPFDRTGPGVGAEFLQIDRARSTAEWLDAWKEFVAAAQNGVVADREGTIAIRSTGKYPVRPDDGRGDVIRDGSTSAADWLGFLPLDLYPSSLNPPQGYLASANQQPVDPRVNPRYFGTNWYSPWRALRINQLLRADSAVTPAAMRRFQTDPGSARADAFVPPFLDAARALDAAGQGDDTLRRAAALLGEWDRRYTRENRRAALFEAAMAALGLLVWDELIPRSPGGGSDATAAPVFRPEEAVLLELMADSSSAWWDDRRTPARETRDAILAEALRRGLARMLREYGPPEGGEWRWSNAHHANIYHLLGLRGLSELDLPVQGGQATLGPSPGLGTHGASWRMVVELGPKVQGWAIYPGGQSGNPASARYSDRTRKWLAGELDSVLFPESPPDLPTNRVKSALTLLGGR